MTPWRKVVLIEPEPVEQIEPGTRRDRQGADIVGKLILEARPFREGLPVGKTVALADEQTAAAATETVRAQFQAVRQAGTDFQSINAGEAVARKQIGFVEL